MAPMPPSPEHKTHSDYNDIVSKPVLQSQHSISSGVGTDESRSCTTSVNGSNSEHDSQSDGEGESLMHRILKHIDGVLCYARHDKATQTFKDPDESEAERLAKDIVYHLLGKKSSKAEDKVTECLRHCVSEMLNKHSIFFTGMMNRLELGPDGDFQSRFNMVADELFEGENVTWGRIVALYAFGGRLAIFCQENNMESFVLEIALHLGDYARSKVAPFVKKNGGWSTLEEVFPCHEDVEGKIWNGLLWAAGIGLGLAGTLSVLAIKS